MILQIDSRYIKVGPDTEYALTVDSKTGIQIIDNSGFSNSQRRPGISKKLLDAKSAFIKENNRRIARTSSAPNSSD